MDLLDQYPNDAGVLDEAPLLASKFGVPDRRPIINLPALLAKAWPGVRDFWHQEIHRAKAHDIKQLEIKQQAQSLAAEEDTSTRRMEAAFLRLYPKDDQQIEILRSYDGGVFDIRSHIGRLAAMSNWWTKTGQEQIQQPGS